MDPESKESKKDPQQPPKDAAPGSDDATKSEGTPAPTPGATEDGGDLASLSHDDLIALVKRGRTEAGSYRTRLRETEAKLTAAKTPEEHEKAVADLQKANAELALKIARQEAATKHGLSITAAGALRGETPEALEEHAKLLASLSAAPASHSAPSGGLSPSSEDDGEMDPRALARLARGRR